MAFKRHLAITTAVSAALLAGCSSKTETADGSWEAEEDVKVCRNKDGNRVDDTNCEYGARSGTGFAWMFLARGAMVPALGQPLKGGSLYKTPGVNYKSASAISRGGFGSSSSSRASSSGRSSFGG
jgi:hypothetical protein